MSEIIGRGAEAILSKDKWDSLDCVVKERVKKGYRVEELDSKLRKERTKEETKLLSEARRVGVPTPQVYERSENVMKIEFLEGERLRDLLPDLSPERRDEVGRKVGKLIAKLHDRGIIHGDLTTSNMIMEDKIYFIDFGLGYFSESMEDKAVDLYLLLEVLRSTHSELHEEIWREVKGGYRQEEGSKKVLKRVKEIGKRGRYVSDR